MLRLSDLFRSIKVILNRGGRLEQKLEVIEVQGLSSVQKQLQARSLLQQTSDEQA